MVLSDISSKSIHRITLMRNLTVAHARAAAALVGSSFRLGMSRKHRSPLSGITFAGEVSKSNLVCYAYFFGGLGLLIWLLCPMKLQAQMGDFANFGVRSARQ